MMGYVKLAAVLAVLGIGFWFNSVLQENKELRLEKAIQAKQIETYEANIELVNAQLAKERGIRENAQKALSELKDVPRVDYQTELPGSIQSVIDNFHDSIGLQY